MNQYEKERIKEIHDEVMRMHFSEDNVLDIINYIDEAILVAKELELGNLLNQLRQTKEKELHRMKLSLKDREYCSDHFNDLKYNFMSDLSLFGFHDPNFSDH